MGIQGADLAASTGIPPGRGGRLDVTADLTVEGYDGVYALGDVANTLGPDGKAFPQLGSVAMQAGRWAANNILADARRARPASRSSTATRASWRWSVTTPRSRKWASAAARLHGPFAFLAWLGVHAVLLEGFRARSEALRSWTWDYFTKSRASALIDRPDAARIDWSGPRSHTVPDVASLGVDGSHRIFTLTGATQ